VIKQAKDCKHWLKIEEVTVICKNVIDGLKTFGRGL